jgi:hypothetical protein
MEDRMEEHENQHLGFDYTRYGLQNGSEFKSHADAAGYWFAVAVLFAFVTAGVIVYRSGGDEFRTATNDVPATAQTSQISQPPLLKAQ